MRRHPLTPTLSPWGRGRSGFTLVELLVVIGLMIALRALAIPTLGAFLKGQRLDQTGRIVQTAFNTAKRVAVTKRARLCIVLYQTEDKTDPMDTIRHAIQVYAEPFGIPGQEGYWEGGYDPPPFKSKDLVLPRGVRFLQDKMEVKVFATLPDPRSDVFRRRQGAASGGDEVVALRSDGSFEERANEHPAVEPGLGINIYDPDEKVFEVPDGTRADIVHGDVDAAGQEISSKGSPSRCLIDLVPSTGRAVAKVFDIEAK